VKNFCTHSAEVFFILLISCYIPV